MERQQSTCRGARAQFQGGAQAGVQRAVKGWRLPCSATICERFPQPRTSVHQRGEGKAGLQDWIRRVAERAGDRAKREAAVHPEREERLLLRVEVLPDPREPVLGRSPRRKLHSPLLLHELGGDRCPQEPLSRRQIATPGDDPHPHGGSGIRVEVRQRGR